MIKEWFKNFLATTAITIIIITLVGVATGDSTVKIVSILPSVAANAAIHLGIYGIRRVASVYLVLELLLEFGFVVGVMLLTGYVSGWFTTTSPWITVGITVVVFAAACLIDIVHLNRELDEINHDIAVRRDVLGLSERDINGI